MNNNDDVEAYLFDARSKMVADIVIKRYRESEKEYSVDPKTEERLAKARSELFLRIVVDQIRNG